MRALVLLTSASLGGAIQEGLLHPEIHQRGAGGWRDSTSQEESCTELWSREAQSKQSSLLVDGADSRAELLFTGRISGLFRPWERPGPPVHFSSRRCRGVWGRGSSLLAQHSVTPPTALWAHMSMCVPLDCDRSAFSLASSVTLVVFLNPS